MRINLHIQFTDGTAKTVTCSAADLVAFEDKFNISVTKLAEDARIGWLLFLAWHSEKRTASTKLEYDKWLETVDTVGESEEDPK
jgi:hypothetical protein